MANQAVLRWVTRWVALAVLACLGCSSDEASYSLVAGSDAPDPGANDDETLRKLQMVRIFDHDVMSSPPKPRWIDVAPDDLISTTSSQNYLRRYCALRHGEQQSGPDNACSGPTNGPNDTCKAEMCQTRVNMCMTHVLLDAAGIRATPVVLHYVGAPNPVSIKLEIPTQSSAAVAALLRLAVKTSTNVSWNATKAILGAAGHVPPGSTCNAAGFDARQSHGWPAYFANAFVESYHLRREATFKAVDAIASYADFRSAHPALGTKIEIGISASQLSRSEAAHFLVGGNAGLPSHVPFCTASELSGPALTALRTLREAAIAPADVLSTVDINDILNVGTSNGAGVRARLARKWNRPSMTTAGPIESQLKISVEDFRAARSYLAQEIRAFSRSRYAKITDDTVGAGNADHSVWAATATEPKQMPPVYYAAIAGYRTTASSPDFIDLGDGYADYITGVVSTIAKVLKSTTVPAAATWDEVKAPLATLQADAGRDRLGKWTYCPSPSHTSTVNGFASTDGVHIVIGEDALRCALYGSIEGASCTLKTSAFSTTWADTELWAVPVNVVKGAFLGYVNATGVDRELPFGVNAYLMQSATGRPGSFKALAGMKRPPGTDCSVVSIVDGVYDRVASLLAPSPKWCSHPTVSCSKGVFDERLPLENELASDGDGVESSWKHYVQLARQAANESDALGLDYIETGLRIDERQESEEIRERANDVQAMQALEELQDICGTNVDPTVLLNTFKNLKTAQGGAITACTSDANCTGTRKCYGGSCIVDPLEVAKTALPQEEYDRLKQCFVDAEIIPFVAVGDRPLCIWRKTGSPNEICGGYTDTFTATANPCPRLAANGSCSSVTLPPGGGYETVYVPDTLDYFDTVAGPPSTAPSVEVCNDVRRVRQTIEVPTAPKRPDLVDRIRTSEFFQPTRLAQLARRIGWDARFGAYSAITVDGAARWQTGDAWAGPMTGQWPCDLTKKPAVCGEPASGLFCFALNGCGDMTARAGLNNRMYRAVTALRATTMLRMGEAHFAGTAFSGINLPGWSTPTRDSVSVRQRAGTSVPVSVIKSNGMTSVPGFTSYDVTFYEVTSTIPNEKIAWATPTYSTTRSNGTGVVDGTPGTIRTFSTNETMGVFPNSIFFEGRSSQVLPMEAREPSFWDGLSSAPHGPPRDWSGYFDQVMRGTRAPSSVGVDRTRQENIPFVLEGTFRPFEWEPRDLFDGMELACEVGAGVTSQCDPARPPQIASVDDLALARQYLSCVAGEIESRAGRTVLAKLPSQAKDALRKESSVGAFPAAGGDWGEEITVLRGALKGLSDVGPELAGELRGLGSDMESLRISLARSGIRDQMADVQFMATVSNQIAACANTNFVTNYLGSLATCANSAAQIEFASQLTKLAEKDSAFARELEINNFNEMFASRTQNLSRLSGAVLDELERIDGSLIRIEQLRSSARRALSMALYMSSGEAATSFNVDEVLRKRLNTGRIRYERAHENAKRLAFLAKRAIEQRLGLRLSEMKEELPLVPAPASWESRVCTAQGVDYSKLRTRVDVNTPAGVVTAGPTDYADTFIGDYVTKLENLVESYRLTYDFHEGSDTAVMSLRDDVQNVRADCETPLPNLLYHSGDFDVISNGTLPGWQRMRCAMNTANPPTQISNCVDVTPTDTPAFPPMNPEVASSKTYKIRFGDGGTCPAATCGWSANAALAQKVPLKAGRYVLSWYADVLPEVNTTSGVVITGLVSLRDAAGAVIAGYAHGADALIPSSGLTRRWLKFELSADQDVFVEVRAPGALRNAKIGAFMLEEAGDAVGTRANRPPRDYVATQDKVTTVLPTCEDTTGAVFRATGWDRRCIYLCPAGFTDDCGSANAQTHCYRETTFGINQRDIESGRVLNASGFARGNFNYRIDSVSVNFVGTEARSCDESKLPTTCFSAGFVPYSLYHRGPFFVRNHMGRDFKASLFEGRIEHARGLALERYITNPLSSTDADLIGQFTRQEFQGRPLDGTFALRVWEEPGVNFDAIEDVQVVLNYRYWTRFD